MKRIITLSIISFLALSFYTGRTQTVVFSSGFETWTSSAPIIPTDWFGAKTSFAANGDSTTQYTSTPHSGTYAIKLQSRTSSHKRLTTHAVPITAGTAYYITFWVRGHGSIRTGLYKGGSALTDYVYNSYIAVNTTTWTQESQAITADTTSAVSTFILSAKLTVADLEDLQVDDVTITTEPIRTVSIYNIQYTTASPANSPLNDSIVTTSGVVSARFNKGFFIQDAYGPWNGVYVYDSAHAAALSLAQGDSVTLTGGVQEYYNYT
jgi:predicted extracellular nuclease